jgi:hypothetical protein
VGGNINRICVVVADLGGFRFDLLANGFCIQENTIITKIHEFFG